MSTPTHLLPDNCYICGEGPHSLGDREHVFWSNRNADTDFRREDRLRSRVGFSEADYVRRYRPY